MERLSENADGSTTAFAIALYPSSLEPEPSPAKLGTLTAEGKPSAVELKRLRSALAISALEHRTPSSLLTA